MLTMKMKINVIQRPPQIPTAKPENRSSWRCCLSLLKRYEKGVITAAGMTQGGLYSQTLFENLVSFC